MASQTFLKNLFISDKDTLLLHLLGCDGDTASMSALEKGNFIKLLFGFKSITYPAFPSNHEKDIFIFSLNGYNGDVPFGEVQKELLFNYVSNIRPVTVSQTSAPGVLLHPVVTSSIVDSSDPTKNPGNANSAHVHQEINPADGQDGAILQQSGNAGSANANMTKVSLPRPVINAIFTHHPYFSNQ